MKNVILMAAILATAAGCTHQGGYGRASSDASHGSSMATMNGWDAVPVAPTRNPDGSIRTPAFAASEADGKARIESELPSDNALKADRVEPYQGNPQKAENTPYADPHRSLSEGSANWNPSDDLLKDGVGRPASIQSENASGTTLSEKVKEQLARETTGTRGITRNDLVRNIKVESHAGVVTLKGSVPTEKDRKMIEVRTAEIEGVQKVNNELVVSEESDPAERN